MIIRKFFFLFFLVFSSLLGMSLNTVHADSVSFQHTYMWKHTTSESWAFMPATGLSNGSVVDALLQFVPNYNFVEGHYYDISITAQHSYSDWSVDRIQFLTNGNSTVITDSTNFSYTFNVIDRYNFVLNLKGVRDIDASRVLQRIRFYAEVVGWNDPTSPGTPQTSIAMGTVVLDIQDSTDKYVLPEINDKLDSTNNKLDEANQKNQTIIDRLTNLPNAIKDMLLGFFVPTESDLEELISDFNELVYDRLGCVAQTLDFFGDIVTSFVSATASDTIYIPKLEVDLPVTNGQVFTIHKVTLWQGGNVEIMPSNWDFAQDNIDYIRFLIDIVCLFMLFRYLLSVFYSFISPEMASSLTLNEILEELELRTLD